MRVRRATNQENKWTLTFLRKPVCTNKSSDTDLLLSTVECYLHNSESVCLLRKFHTTSGLQHVPPWNNRNQRGWWTRKEYPSQCIRLKKHWYRCGMEWKENVPDYTMPPKQMSIDRPKIIWCFHCYWRICKLIENERMVETQLCFLADTSFPKPIKIWEGHVHIIDQFSCPIPNYREGKKKSFTRLCTFDITSQYSPATAFQTMKM